MNDFSAEILNLLQQSSASPFLFVGSGFSRRYFNLPKWDELLKHFCKDDNEYDQLLASSNSDLPKLAELLAEKYHDRWWNADEFQNLRERKNTDRPSERLKNKTSALRLEICNYLSELSKRKSVLSDELDVMRGLNIDGIITTNWDNLLEKIFPDHQVYIGQEDLIFSNTQSIGEIYKIHGCVSNIESLVLTKNDYENFHRLNPYLAAKLITLFVEHPIVFVGYSMNDANIIGILTSIVDALNQEKLSILSRNLIFLQRANGNEPSIESVIMQFGGRRIPTTVVKTDNYGEMYKAISLVEKKIPVKLIRMYKEQFYEIVSNSEPSKQMHVVNEQDFTKDSKIQFVVGLSVATDAKTAIGYKGITVIDLFLDLLEDRGYDSQKIIDYTIATFSASTKYIPLFKHLRNIGINDVNKATLKHTAISNRLPKNAAKFYQSASHSRRFQRDAANLSCSQIIKNFDPSIAAYFIPFLPDSKIKINQIENFLKENIDRFNSGPKSTPFRKLACFYDWKKNGF